MSYTPQVLLDGNNRPLIVFGKGRLLYSAIVAGDNIKLTKLETLRGMRSAEFKGEPYPVQRAASFYLNHTDREITPRAKLVLRGLVRRQSRAAA